MANYLSLRIAQLICSTLPLALPGVAQANDLFSGELQLNLARNSDTGINFKRAEGSFETQLDGPVNAQIDLGMSKFEAVNSTSPFLGLHVIYTPTDALDVAAFVSGEDRLGTSYLIYGAEMAYQTETWGLEAYLGEQKPITSGAAGRGTLAGVEAHFDLGASQKWQLFTGAHVADLDNGKSDSVYLGVTRNLGRGASLSARVGQQDGSDTVLAVMASFTLGEGVTFNRRDWFSGFTAQ